MIHKLEIDKCWLRKIKRMVGDFYSIDFLLFFWRHIWYVVSSFLTGWNPCPWSGSTDSSHWTTREVCTMWILYLLKHYLQGLLGGSVLRLFWPLQDTYMGSIPGQSPRLGATKPMGYKYSALEPGVETLSLCAIIRNHTLWSPRSSTTRKLM